MSDKTVLRHKDDSVDFRTVKGVTKVAIKFRFCCVSHYKESQISKPTKNEKEDQLKEFRRSPRIHHSHHHVLLSHLKHTNTEAQKHSHIAISHINTAATSSTHQIVFPRGLPSSNSTQLNLCSLSAVHVNQIQDVLISNKKYSKFLKERPVVKVGLYC